MASKVAQFVAVTGAPSTTAKNLLEACGGNLDLAINMYLESASSDTLPATAAAGPSRSTTSGVTDVDNGGEMLSPTSYQERHGVRAPIPQTRGVLIEDEPAPDRILRSRRLPKTVFDPFQDYSTVATARKLPGPGDEKHKRNLSELFKPPHDILFNGTFQEARVSGEMRHCWLLVNMQDSKEFACQVLNRDLWSNFNVKDIVREHFVFMQLHRITDSGVRFKQLYNVDSFPFIAIIDPRTGEKMASWRSLTVSEFMKVIPEFLADNPFTGVDQHDNQHQDSKKGSVSELSEESQLEAAIKASLQEATPQGRSKNDVKKKSSSKYQLIFSDDSDDECITLSSDEETTCSDMDTDMISGDHSQSHSKPLDSWKDSVTSKHIVPHLLNGPNLDSVTEVGCSSVSIKQKQVTNDRRTRKRHLSSQTSNEQDSGARKVLRIDDFPTDTTDSGRFSQVNGRTENKTSSKGETANGSASNLPTVNLSQKDDLEAQLMSGNVKREDLVQIVLRLPDGARLQKSFVCTHPIKAPPLRIFSLKRLYTKEGRPGDKASSNELFSFLQSQNIDISEHEVMTHFPKRSISELEPSITFKDAGLYPRETLFIHSVE